MTPKGHAGSFVGDLISRRRQIQGQHVRGDADVIDAMVPLADMLGYADQIRSFTQGRATFTMRFNRYAPCPTRDDDGPPPTAAAALRA